MTPQKINGINIADTFYKMGSRKSSSTEALKKGGRMEIIENKQDEILIFKLKGRLDWQTSPVFEEKILCAINDGTNIIHVDLGELEYISSTGIRVILKAYKNLKRLDGRFVMCSMYGFVKEVFETAFPPHMLTANSG